uniref:thiopurine S-methyltransferase-like n=1 Tax=Styela clava TaxID=7725 RepID=UPI00193ABF65|nr:thiopurine S-methyltransferase-like [Styela clava]
MAGPLDKQGIVVLDQVWTMEDWDKFWNSAANIPFQINDFNPELLKLEKMLFPIPNKKYRVLFPLCGKSYDMKWVADKGHAVIGVDCSAKPLEDFFNEHGITYVERQESSCQVLQSTTEGCNITLYAGDIFNLPDSAFEKCDAVFDYGSVIAIKPEERKKYADVMNKTTTSDVRYLLCAFDFNGYMDPKPPTYPNSPEMVTDAFGDIFNIKPLLDVDRERYLRGVPTPIAKELYYYLTKK